MANPIPYGGAFQGTKEEYEAYLNRINAAYIERLKSQNKFTSEAMYEAAKAKYLKPGTPEVATPVPDVPAPLLPNAPLGTGSVPSLTIPQEVAARSGNWLGNAFPAQVSGVPSGMTPTEYSGVPPEAAALYQQWLQSRIPTAGVPPESEKKASSKVPSLTIPPDVLPPKPPINRAYADPRKSVLTKMAIAAGMVQATSQFGPGALPVAVSVLPKMLANSPNIQPAGGLPPDMREEANVAAEAEQVTTRSNERLAELNLQPSGVPPGIGNVVASAYPTPKAGIGGLPPDMRDADYLTSVAGLAERFESEWPYRNGAWQEAPLLTPDNPYNPPLIISGGGGGYGWSGSARKSAMNAGLVNWRI